MNKPERKDYDSLFVYQNDMRKYETYVERKTMAKAEAEAITLTGDAEAEAITLTGDAEASAIRARGEALRDNPNLINLVQAERWNGTLPTTMVPGQTVPLLNVGQ